MTLETRRLGGTSVEVTVLGLGGATLGGNRVRLTDTDARVMVLDAWDSDIRYFDTAPFYGYGRSEHLMGDGLRQKDGWVLSTKVGRRLKARRTPQALDDAWINPLPFEYDFDYSYDGAMRSYEDSIQRLGLDHIDILYIHDIDGFTHGAERQHEMHRAAMEGAYRALDELRRRGLIEQPDQGPPGRLDQLRWQFVRLAWPLQHPLEGFRFPRAGPDGTTCG